ncbi:protein phosphatase 2C domain-containing protein [Actinoplanes sp. HUAS TT8]|uniref:protein phosphatase 2C domain-containing protein n=1 Tax=Actinoplanes sp. HUAS TT8 TaxID=3447453 RepID=UPI003F51C22E
MRARLATLPASPDRPNEDFAAVTPDAAVLLDGAGAADLANGCRHGVAWFTRHLGTAILARLADDPLPAVLASAITATADAHRDTCDLTDPGSPSATVIITRFTGPAVEYLILADSVLLLSTASGSPQVLTDPRVEAVGNRYRATMDSLRNGTPEHAEARRAFVRATLEHRNRPGRYWVASADPSVATEAITGSAVARSIALLSDGATRLVDTFGLETWSSLWATLASTGPAATQHDPATVASPSLAQGRHASGGLASGGLASGGLASGGLASGGLASGGPEEVLRRTRAAELSDPTGERWPRAKPHDDATAIYLDDLHER